MQLTESILNEAKDLLRASLCGEWAAFRIPHSSFLIHSTVTLLARFRG